MTKAKSASLVKTSDRMDASRARIPSSSEPECSTSAQVKPVKFAMHGQLGRSNIGIDRLAAQIRDRSVCGTNENRLHIEVIEPAGLEHSPCYFDDFGCLLRDADLVLIDRGRQLTDHEELFPKHDERRRSE